MSVSRGQRREVNGRARFRREPTNQIALMKVLWQARRKRGVRATYKTH